MRTTGSIPLIRASGMGTLPRILEERAGTPAMLAALKAEGLPAALCELPGLPIPATAMFGLFTRAAHMLADRTLGLDLGRQMSYVTYGQWSSRSIGLPSLGAAIRQVNRTSWMHQASGFSFSLHEEKEVGIWRVSRPPFLRANLQHSDHMLFPMMDFARVFLGRNWWPEWVELDYPRDAMAVQIERALGIPVRFGQASVGLAIRHAHLHDRNVATAPAPHREGDTHDGGILADVALPDAQEPVRSFSAIVMLRLHDGLSDIEGAAQLSGLGVRALQRRLQEAGYTYRDILDVARCKRASTLLAQSGMSLSDIAISLGYEEQASFTRAFRRWTGHAPSEIRNQFSRIRN